MFGLLPFIFRTGASALMFMTMQEAFRRSGSDPAKQAITTKEQGTAMGYDIIGAGLESLIAGLDDDSFGSVGSDEALLDALSVSGSGTTDIIGAAERRGAQKAVAAIAAKRGAAVVDRGVSKRRKMPIGFAPTSIAAGSSGTIPGQPQNLFRTERLVIPSDIAFDLGVTDLKVGNQSQFAQSNEVPAVIFSEVAINTGVEFDTAEVGNQISLICRNKDIVNAVEFTAAAVGTVAK
jgi:hypothetical protein